MSDKPNTMDELAEALTPEQIGYLMGRRGGGKTAGLRAATGGEAPIAGTGEPPPSPPVMQDAGEAQEDKDEQTARLRRGSHAVQKGHRIEIHRDDSVVQVRTISRRAAERNKYADVPRGTVSERKRARLSRKNGAEANGCSTGEAASVGGEDRGDVQGQPDGDGETVTSHDG